jgi:hypothetical protein
LDKAIAMENKRLELGEIKRKATNQGQARSSTRPRYATPQGTPAHGSPRCRCFGSDRTPGVAPQGVLGVGRYRRL